MKNRMNDITYYYNNKLMLSTDRVYVFVINFGLFNSNDFLDIFIISKCKFMICTEHGLAEVATAMRVPRLIVNFWFWYDIENINITPIILPKKIFS